MGTKPVMKADFYRDRFYQHGIEAIAPNSQQCRVIDTIIFDELVFGTKDESRKTYIDIMRELAERGAQGIVLGCTEIEMLIKPKDIPELPLFDTTALPCQKAVNLALGVESMPLDPVKSAA